MQLIIPGIIGEHETNGFPVCWGGQKQTGIWLTHWHCAFIPQAPGQGSLHLLFMQAWFVAQSELITHSGRHAKYGFPKYSCLHSQVMAPLSCLHFAFAPHWIRSQESVLSIA